MSDIIRVIIENFQSHENTVLDFSKGLNVIVGPSDQGKSAVIRAIKWVLYNEPRGIEFIRHGTNTARVTLVMDSGFKIIRERSKSRNRYIVISSDETESVYEGFGNEIPKEVINAHGIPKVLLDADISSSLNIGEQLDGPFLLSETGAIRAKAIGRLTGIHIIDNAIKDGMTDLRRENQMSDRIQNEIASMNTKLEEYRHLDEIKGRMAASENLIEKLDLKISRLQKLSTVEEKLKIIEKEFIEVKEKLEKLRGIDKCDEIIINYNSAVLRIQKAIKTDKEYKILYDEFNRVDSALSRTRNIEGCHKILNRIEAVKLIYEKLIKIKNLKSNIYPEKEKLEEVLKYTLHTDKLLNSVTGTVSNVGKYRKLISLKEKYNHIKSDIVNVEKYSESYKSIDSCISIKDELVKKHEKIKRLNEIKIQDEVINSNMAEGLKFIENNKQQLKKYADEYIAHLKKAGKCPTCGNDISELKVNEIIKHYEEVH